MGVREPPLKPPSRYAAALRRRIALRSVCPFSLSGELDLDPVVVAGADVDLAFDRAVAGADDLQAMAAGGEAQRLRAAAGSPELAVDVDGGVGGLELEAHRAR